MQRHQHGSWCSTQAPFHHCSPQSPALAIVSAAYQCSEYVSRVTSHSVTYCHNVPCHWLTTREFHHAVTSWGGAASIFSALISTNSNIWFTTCANISHLYSLPKTLALCYCSLKINNSVKVWCLSLKGSGDGRGQRNYNLNKGAALLAADSSSSSPNVVVCLLFVCRVQVEKLLANCYLTAT